MPVYLAKYTVWAHMFDSAWMPDPEPHKPEYRFEAKDAEEAARLAETHMETFKDEYFGPRATLDELLEVREIKGAGPEKV